MRLIDSDSLIHLVTDSTILGDGFKTAFCALVNGEPTVKVQKTGHWIPGKEISLTMLGNTVLERQYADYTCSECGHKYKKMPEGYFCQYCGSQNRGKEE